MRPGPARLRPTKPSRAGPHFRHIEPGFWGPGQILSHTIALHTSAVCTTTVVLSIQGESKKIIPLRFCENFFPVAENF